MKIEEITADLENHLWTFNGLFLGLSPEQYNFKASPESWSIKDVLCHLVDEERLDFRARFMHLCESPDKPMPGINPPAWVIDHDYLNKDFDNTLSEFKKERNNSIVMLCSIENIPWDNCYEHPVLGTVSPQYFLENWLAHDLLHQRQILRIQYAYLKSKTQGSLSYAGEW